MKFDVTFTDASGKLNTREQITATMRGESENTNVADHVAKSLAKRYAAVLKNCRQDQFSEEHCQPFFVNPTEASPRLSPRLA